MTPREVYIQKLREVERINPFSPSEMREYSYQDRQFIRSIQVSTGKRKISAISEFRAMKKDRDRLIRGRARIEQAYDGRLKLPPQKPDIPIESQPNKPKKTYKYKGVVVRARADVVDRYRPDYSTPARRYTDTVTGETISRREKDKRIARSLL